MVVLWCTACSFTKHDADIFADEVIEAGSTLLDETRDSAFVEVQFNGADSTIVIVPSGQPLSTEMLVGLGVDQIQRTLIQQVVDRRGSRKATLVIVTTPMGSSSVDYLGDSVEVTGQLARSSTGLVRARLERGNGRPKLVAIE